MLSLLNNGSFDECTDFHAHCIPIPLEELVLDASASSRDSTDLIPRLWLHPEPILQVEWIYFYELPPLCRFLADACLVCPK
jgi:hypothetical protein